MIPTCRILFTSLKTFHWIYPRTKIAINSKFNCVLDWYDRLGNDDDSEVHKTNKSNLVVK